MIVFWSVLSDFFVFGERLAGFKLYGSLVIFAVTLCTASIKLKQSNELKQKNKEKEETECEICDVSDEPDDE